MVTTQKAKLSPSTRRAGAALVKKVKGNMLREKVSLEAPWETYRKELYNLLTPDHELMVSDHTSFVSESVYEATISSTNYNKLMALKKILNNEVVFGNVTLKISFEYDAPVDEDNSQDWRDAFEGNPLFDRIESVGTPDGSTVNYAIFNREIISFFDDDLSDYHGNKHMIVADIVKDVISDTSVYPCTEFDAENM
jgi:hypothetical protein